jgi:hypothetical protein
VAVPCELVDARKVLSKEQIAPIRPLHFVRHCVRSLVNFIASEGRLISVANLLIVQVPLRLRVHELNGNMAVARVDQHPPIRSR